MRRVLAAALLALPATPVPASADAPTCVAVVVDYRELGGAPSTWCAKGEAGRTGAEILHSRAKALGRPEPRYRGDGLICTIDGLPAGGCEAVDENNYWAYHFREAGRTAWTYSSKGPADTAYGRGRRPKHAESEGWVWTGGTGQGARTPAGVAYTSICPASTPTVTSKPTPTPTPTRTATTTPSAAAPTTSRPVPTVTVVVPTVTVPTSTVPLAPGPPATDSVPIANLPARGQRGFPWGAVTGLALVAGLGAAAVLRKRRT
jgi:hypothetical protein